MELLYLLGPICALFSEEFLETRIDQQDDRKHAHERLRSFPLEQYY